MTTTMMIMVTSTTMQMMGSVSVSHFVIDMMLTALDGIVFKEK